MGNRDTSRTEEWGRVLEKLIVGVAHHISNRVSTLAGISDLLADNPTIPPILRALADEVPKLEESVRLLWLLGTPDEPEEALEPLPLIRDAVTLARLHPDIKEVGYAIDAENLPPVLARSAALTHEILVALIKGAERQGGQSIDRQVTVRASVEGDELVVTVGEHVVRARTLVAARQL